VDAKRMAFIHYNPNPQEDTTTYSPLELPSGVTHHALANVDLYIVPVNDGMARSALPFYMAFIKSGNGHPNTAPLLETAMFLALFSKDKKTFMELYELYGRLLDKDFRVVEGHGY